jgi:DNA-binding response OmpR family regulator
MGDRTGERLVGPRGRRRASEAAPAAGVAARGRVLVVEDEPDVATLLRHHLTREGYEVVIATSGPEALRRARELRPDVVLLDIMVPELDGWEVCRRLRQEPATLGIPVIMVTGRVGEADKVRGFEAGVDDYVTKPFSARELVARVRAVTRRARADMAERAPLLRIGDVEIDRARFEVRAGGRAVEATPKEFELLATLAGRPGRVFRREELLDLVWGRDGFVEPRTVDVHLARLRAKFVEAGLTPPPIDTVRGVGYRCRDPAGSGR